MAGGIAMKKNVILHVQVVKIIIIMKVKNVLQHVQENLYIKMVIFVIKKKIVIL